MSGKGVQAVNQNDLVSFSRIGVVVGRRVPVLKSYWEVAPLGRDQLCQVIVDEFQVERLRRLKVVIAGTRPWMQRQVEEIIVHVERDETLANCAPAAFPA